MNLTKKTEERKKDPKIKIRFCLYQARKIKGILQIAYVNDKQKQGNIYLKNYYFK